MSAPIPHRRCNQCTRGRSPDHAATFASWCPGCQEKLIDGRRTGREPPPARYGRVKLPADRFAAVVARQAAEQAGRRRRVRESASPKVPA
jgi:hypothetical protein